MPHLSLYRKFRPDTFDKMVRQEHVVRILKNQITGGSVGHAYLFCGPRGTGKTSIARIFARAVNCEQPKDGSPCGVCGTCRALAEGSLDVTEIDAASNNGVNEMRELREKVQYPPVSGRYKVYIIDEVHMLTDSAFNALLKTLEEPPAHAVFVLATTEPQKIPATILSRCMRLDFKLIPEEDLEAHLKRILDEIGKPYEEAAVAAIARAGAGSDRDMLSIAEMCIAYSEKLTYASVNEVLGAADFRETGALVSALLNADGGEALSLTEKILAEGKSVGVLCKDILRFLNQVAVAKTCKNAEKLLFLPKDLFRAVSSVAEQSEGAAILRATEIFARLEPELRYATSPRICLETAVLRTATPAAELSMDALLVRVSELEKKLAAAGAGALLSAPAPKKESKPSRAPERELPPPPEEDDAFAFPPAEPVYFDEPYPPQEEPVRREKPVPRPAPALKAAPISEPDPFSANQTAPVAASGGKESAEVAFGRFIKALRKTSRNGVLFTMCADLVASYEGEKLVLETESETIFCLLSREDHRAIMQSAFSLAGVAEFEVRKKGADAPKERDGIEQLKRDFSGYPVEVK